MRPLMAMLMWSTSCVSFQTSQAHARQSAPLLVALSVTEHRSPAVVDSTLRRAMHARGVTVARSGEMADYMLIVVAECAPARAHETVCGDSSRLMLGLWSAAPEGQSRPIGLVPRGFLSEQHWSVRIRSDSVSTWLVDFVTSIDLSCFDRTRLKRAPTQGAQPRRDYLDDSLWTCRLPSGRVRAP